MENKEILNKIISRSRQPLSEYQPIKIVITDDGFFDKMEVGNTIIMEMAPNGEKMKIEDLTDKEYGRILDSLLKVLFKNSLILKTDGK